MDRKKVYGGKNRFDGLKFISRFSSVWKMTDKTIGDQLQDINKKNQQHFKE